MTSRGELRHGIPSRDGLPPASSLTASVRVHYTVDELLSLRRDHLPLARPVRKAIFKHRLWKPYLLRQQQPVTGNPSESKHVFGIPRQSADRLPAITTDCSQQIPVINGRGRRRQQQQQPRAQPHAVRCSFIKNIETFEQFVPSFLTANIRGGLMQKVDELQAVFQENCVDIASITETWLHADVPDDVVDIPGYVIHRADRCDGRRGGGVAVFVRQELMCHRLTAIETTSMEAVWLLYRRPRMPRQLSHVAVGAIYHPPNADGRTMIDYIVQCLDTITRDHPNAGVVLLGDFNKLRDNALLAYPLRQVVRSPTRGSAILDKVYTNISEWYERPFILPNIGRSDHDAVSMCPKTSRPTERGTDVMVQVRSRDPNGQAMLADAIQNVNWTPLYRMESCEEMASYFYNTVTGLIDCHLPFISVKRHTTDKPWVTDKFRQLIRCRQHALKNGQIARYKSYRNRVNRMTGQLRQKFYSRKMKGLRNRDPHNWWRNVKQVTGLDKKSSHQPLLALANQLHDGNMQDLADDINVFFQQVAADLSPLDTNTTLPQSEMSDEFIIDQAAVERKLSQINVYKSPGPDGLPNWILRDFCTELAGPVCAIFNASVRQGIVPSRWKEANVVPAPKSHPPRSIQSDLRPISLTATLGKILESFVGEWILERVGCTIDNRQYGAFRQRSTTHALVDMMHHWHSTVDGGRSVRIVFVDFAKAFDRVDHNVLMSKLMALNLPDVIIRWMYSFLLLRHQRVKIGDVLSDWLPQTAGMPQGSYLGPLTFAILIASLQPSCLTHKYIDDTTMTEIINRGSASCMKVFVDELVSQSTQAGMLVNGKKTKEMLVGSVTKNPPAPLLLNDITVERVSTFKLLGVYVSSDLKWTKHIDATACKIASRLYFMRQLKRAGATTSDLICFFCTVIRPILEYANPVWHSSLTMAQSDILESQQKRAMNIIYGAGINYTAALTNAGLDTLRSRREELNRRFFTRHVLSEDSCLHYLLPPKREENVTCRLRKSRTFETSKVKTNRFYNSFIPYAIRNFQ